MLLASQISYFFFNVPATTEIYTLSLHAALPILLLRDAVERRQDHVGREGELLELEIERSEEHTSELQSRENLVCRLLLEKKKKEPQLAFRDSKATRNEQL